MTQTPLSLPQPRGFGGTSRRDVWWLQPMVVFLGLSAFIVYSTWAAFQGTDYLFTGGGASYLSPFYSPEIFGDSGHAIFGPKPDIWPAWLPFSPALLILWAPGGFRFTCYYYRGAYYKAFAADPANCAVGEPRSCYRGEHSLPMVLQNIHRYFLYLALVFIVILAWDAWEAMWFTDAEGVHFGLGIGSLVLIINVILLGGVHLWVSCPSSPCWRAAQHLVTKTRATKSIFMRDLPQQTAHALGLVEFVLGGLHRLVRSDVRNRRVDRLENLLTDRYKTHLYDVLVIGAGGAGLRAAIESSGMDVSVGVVCKSLLGKAHTVMAEGGMAASMGNVDDRDNWKVHFADTMRGGQYLNNCNMAYLHAQEAPDRVHELESWGALFDRTKDGQILQRNFGGHKYPRLAHVGDRTGLEMIRTLQDHGIHQGINFHMEVTVTNLLVEGGRIVGAFAYEREKGRFLIFKAKAIIIATGGIGRAFKVTSNSWEYTGDGHALAYDAGADLQDMEFVQFHPTGMIWPPSVRGILVTEGVRGEGGILTNSEGKRFMFEDVPDLYKDQTANNEEEGWRYVIGDKDANRPPELLTRDHVARKIVKEVKEGRGSPHGGVFLDIAWIKEHIKDAESHIKKKLPSMYHQFKELAEVDITKEPMEVGPTTHYMMGGIRVDAETQMSSVDGLFACGECAGGLHGANRLGGNSLSDLLVFGKRAGKFAAKFAKDNGDTPDIKDESVETLASTALAPVDRADGENPYTIQQDLQETMQDLAGITRSAEDLTTAIGCIVGYTKRAENAHAPGNREYNPGWHTALDLHNLMVVSEAVCRSALQRNESRGGHFRSDFPEKSEEGSTYNTVVRRAKDGSMEVERLPVAALTDEMQEIIEGAR